MAKTRFKPYWEELKSLQVIQIVGGQEVIPVPNVKSFLMYLQERGINFSISQTLLDKDFLSKAEYDSIVVPELHLESFTEGENDTISAEILNRFKRTTKK